MQTSTTELADDTPTVEGDTGAAPRTGLDRLDALALVVAAVATVAVHPVHLVLSRPYWMDEAWVAVLTKVPLRRLVHISSSTPVGFAVLLRSVPGAGLQRARLVVLAFSALTTAAAYVFARSFGWATTARARFAGVVAAAAVMLAPISLVRNDLKQYTCDAFCALAILTVTTWIDRSDGRMPIWWLTIASLAAIPFSTTSAFVTIAAFGGLFAVTLAARVRRRVYEVLVWGGITAAGLGVYFGAIVLPNTNAQLRAYWNASYLYGSPSRILRDSWSRLSSLSARVGMPALVLVVLFLVGIAVLARLRTRAVAVALPLLWFEMAVVGRAHRYPFLDQRTSHFLLVPTIVVATAGVAFLLQRTYEWKRIGGIVVAVAVAWSFGAGVRHHVRELAIPHEDVRSQAQYVAAHRGAGDVILVSYAAGYGFSYYWPHAHLTTGPLGNAAGFGAQVDGIGALYAPDRTDPAVSAALRQAVDRWRAAGPGHRLFVVRSHVSHAEALAWQRAFTELGLHPRRIATGTEPLLVVDPT